MKNVLKKIWIHIYIYIYIYNNYRSIEPLGQYHKPYSLTKKLVEFFSLAFQNILKYITFIYDVLWPLLTNFILLPLHSP